MVTKPEDGIETKFIAVTTDNVLHQGYVTNLHELAVVVPPVAPRCLTVTNQEYRQASDYQVVGMLLGYDPRFAEKQQSWN